MVTISCLSKTVKWEGLPLVEGFSKGVAFVLKPLSEYEIKKTQTPEKEKKIFQRAVKLFEKELKRMLNTKISTEQKELLEISKTMLSDRGWNLKINEGIQKGFTAETAIHQATEEITARMEIIQDAYLRERMHDFQDLAGRLLQYLDKSKEKYEFKEIILIAESLGPAQLMDYDLSKIKGIVLAEGSTTMHVAIVARAYGIPLITGIPEIWQKIQTGDNLALNATKGVVYKNPSDEIMDEFKAAKEKQEKQKKLDQQNKQKPAFTKDGVKIELGINLGLADDILLNNAPPFDKVGLYRTELPFMLAKELPNSEQQICIYKKVLAHAKGKPVVFRTLDIGSDKILPYTRPLKEENPAMGWRSTRMTLDRRALLRTQLRALIRAVEGAPLYVMFPMIGDVSEFLTAKQTLDFELKLAKQNHETLPAQVFVGTMFEIPSLFFYLKNNIQLFDFISIGTNDLKQFFFATDRGNRTLTGRFDNLSPAFLDFLSQIQKICQLNRVPCSICGEMAGNPMEALVLIGLGFTSLSMNPQSVLKVKTALRKLDQKEFSEFLMRLLRTEKISLRSAVSAYLRDHQIWGD